MSWQGLWFVMAAKLAGPWWIWQSAKVEIFMAAGVIRVLLRIVNQSKKTAGEWLKLLAPAKVNLMLSVHGRRGDGFHELTSLVAALEFGDELDLRINDRQCDRLECDGQSVPLDDSNLVLQAAELFRRESGLQQCFDFRLKKRIPVGAGLGGGSSDAVAALKGMNALLDAELESERLRELASSLGSDCPFFVDATPALMRGRGERIEPLAEMTASRLAGQRLVLFRPDFPVDTAWAYRQLASKSESYESKASGERRLKALHGGGDLGDLLHNVFEDVVGRKYVAIPCLLEILREKGYRAMMSGSGSACFALVDESAQDKAIKEICFDCWGESTFWVETSLAEQKM
jgi:4-diphosphocytidyl-2-C-methyl-D-erythritol kinase